jgi:hypothetical protein
MLILKFEMKVVKARGEMLRDKVSVAAAVSAAGFTECRRHACHYS